MSFYQTGRSLPQQFRLVLVSFLQASDLPFSDVLTEKEISEAFEEEESWFSQEEGDIFTPPLTLWAFLSQILHKGEQRSCLAAVSRIIVLLVALGREPCANNSGGYCSGKETGELALMRQLLDQLDPDDILLTDRYFCSYFMIALLLAQNTDFVARLHHARKAEAYHLKRLGKKDYLIQWHRPQRPDWMDRETYDRMPESLTLRQIEVCVTQPGFRVESLVVVTTLTDPKEYSQDDVAELYHKRWLVELDILPTLDHSSITLMITAQRASLARPIVGNRPNRIEPRAVKRRPKPMRLLNMPREAAREQLRRGVDPYTSSGSAIRVRPLWFG